MFPFPPSPELSPALPLGTALPAPRNRGQSPLQRSEPACREAVEEHEKRGRGRREADDLCKVITCVPKQTWEAGIVKVMSGSRARLLLLHPRSEDTPWTWPAGPTLQTPCAWDSNLRAWESQRAWILSLNMQCPSLLDSTPAGIQAGAWSYPPQVLGQREVATGPEPYFAD